MMRLLGIEQIMFGPSLVASALQPSAGWRRTSLGRHPALLVPRRMG